MLPRPNLLNHACSLASLTSICFYSPCISGLMTYLFYFMNVALALVTDFVGPGLILIQDATTNLPIKYIQTEASMDLMCFPNHSVFDINHHGYIRDTNTGRYLVFNDKGILAILYIPQLGFDIRKLRESFFQSGLEYKGRSVFRLCNGKYICDLCVCQNPRSVTLVLDSFLLPCVVSHSGLWKGQREGWRIQQIT